MSKFRVKLKLTGLEFEVEGTREDVPMIAKNISAQLGNLMLPAAALAEGRALPAANHELIDVTPRNPVTPDAGRGRAGKRVRRNGATTGAGGTTASDVFDFRHDPEAWGSPIQVWSTADKAMWLLYISDKQGAPKEMTITQVANTFNKHFKQAGMLRAHNVSRDLGKLKGKPPAKVAEDSTKSPSTWYLTDAGIKAAEALVAAARGAPATAA